jgi:Ca2+-binding RTX toxin-like protein
VLSVKRQRNSTRKFVIKVAGNPHWNRTEPSQEPNRHVYTLSVGNDIYTLSVGNDIYTLSVGNDIYTLSVGNDIYTLSVGNDIYS